jgi:hypothetical protein
MPTSPRCLYASYFLAAHFQHFEHYFEHCFDIVVVAFAMLAHIDDMLLFGPWNVHLTNMTFHIVDIVHQIVVVAFFKFFL